jgi:DNA adenine methylase
MTSSIMGYYGSKHRCADWLISLMPPHLGYVEPFAGSLSVLGRKAPVKIETVNDLDENIITFWRVLRDRTEDLERACSLTPHSRIEHAESIPLRPDPYDELEHARRVWVRLAQGRAGQLRRTGWRFHATAAGSGSGMARRLDAYVGRFADQHRALAEVLVECKAMVLLSGYASPLYDDLFEGWERHEFATWTGQGNSRAARTEVAWANYRLELSLGVEGGA